MSILIGRLIMAILGIVAMVVCVVLLYKNDVKTVFKDDAPQFVRRYICKIFIVCAMYGSIIGFNIFNIIETIRFMMAW